MVTLNMSNRAVRSIVWSGCVALGLCLCFFTPASAVEPDAPIPEPYRIEPLRLPGPDHSGEVGQRLLRLLSLQVEQGLRWIEKERAVSGIADERFIIHGCTNIGAVPAYDLGQAVSCLSALAVLSRCGQPDETMAGTTPEKLQRTAAALIRATLDSHPAGGGPNPQAAWWDKFWGIRLHYHLALGASLVWNSLDAPTQLRLARVLEREADLFLAKPVPAQMRKDTHSEFNAWNGAGMAAVACLLKHHPRRTAWADKARELMLSAYATPQDVASSRVVDGKPLNQWLTAPNAFPDHTVENHGFVHPLYIAAISEKVRSAIIYRLAGEPISEAATLNAAPSLDVLLWMTLPDGNYLYPQGTDYCSRNLGSFFQACNVVPLAPDPLRHACFLRSLASIEKMAAERPDLPMSGWLGMPYESGMLWGLTENYLMRRLFGPGGDVPLTDRQIEQRLTGGRIFEEGMFAIHRTSTSISSFSWRATSKNSTLMGMTLPLNRDTLIYPMPGSLIGGLREAAGPTNSGSDERPTVCSHQVSTTNSSLSVLLELQRCGGKVAQNCAFVSLPDGSSVYLEERIAKKAVALTRATSGNIVINDDIRWVYQSKPRQYFGQTGPLQPSNAIRHQTAWLNIDGQQGYVALGGAPLRLEKVAGQPGIWRNTGTLYDTCRSEFVQLPKDDEADAAPIRFEPGRRIGTFGLITLPTTRIEETKSLAGEISKTGWIANEAGFLAVKIKSYLVYANFSDSNRRIAIAGTNEIPRKTCGWIR
jgi:hypothetical protein